MYERIYGDNDLIEYDGEQLCLERFTTPAATYSIDNKPLIDNGNSYITSPLIRNKNYFNELNIDNIEVSKSLNSIWCVKDEYLEVLNNNQSNEEELEIEELNETPGEIIPEDKFKCLCVNTVFNTFDNNEVSMNNYNNDERYFVFGYIYNTCFIKHFYTKTIDEFITKHKKIIDIINSKDLSKIYNEENYINEIFPYRLVDFFNINKITFNKLDFIKQKYNIEYIN